MVTLRRTANIVPLYEPIKELQVWIAGALAKHWRAYVYNIAELCCDLIRSNSYFHTVERRKINMPARAFFNIRHPRHYPQVQAGKECYITKNNNSADHVEKSVGIVVRDPNGSQSIVVSCYATNLRTTMYIYQLHPHITLYKVDSYFTLRSVQQLLHLLDFLTCLNLTFS